MISSILFFDTRITCFNLNKPTSAGLFGLIAKSERISMNQITLIEEIIRSELLPQNSPFFGYNNLSLASLRYLEYLHLQHIGAAWSNSVLASQASNDIYGDTKYRDICGNTITDVHNKITLLKRDVTRGNYLNAENCNYKYKSTLIDYKRNTCGYDRNENCTSLLIIPTNTMMNLHTIKEQTNLEKSLKMLSSTIFPSNAKDLLHGNHSVNSDFNNNNSITSMPLFSSNQYHSQNGLNTAIISSNMSESKKESISMLEFLIGSAKNQHLESSCMSLLPSFSTSPFFITSFNTKNLGKQKSLCCKKWMPQKMCATSARDSSTFCIHKYIDLSEQENALISNCKSNEQEKKQQIDYNIKSSDEEKDITMPELVAECISFPVNGFENIAPPRLDAFDDNVEVCRAPISIDCGDSMFVAFEIFNEVAAKSRVVNSAIATITQPPDASARIAHQLLTKCEVTGASCVSNDANIKRCNTKLMIFNKSFFTSSTSSSSTKIIQLKLEDSEISSYVADADSVYSVNINECSDRKSKDILKFDDESNLNKLTKWKKPSKSMKKKTKISVENYDINESMVRRSIAETVKLEERHIPIKSIFFKSRNRNSYGLCPVASKKHRDKGKEFIISNSKKTEEKMQKKINLEFLENKADKEYRRRLDLKDRNKLRNLKNYQINDILKRKSTINLEKISKIKTKKEKIIIMESTVGKIDEKKCNKNKIKKACHRQKSDPTSTIKEKHTKLTANMIMLTLKKCSSSKIKSHSKSISCYPSVYRMKESHRSHTIGTDDIKWSSLNPVASMHIECNWRPIDEGQIRILRCGEAYGTRRRCFNAIRHWSELDEVIRPRDCVKIRSVEGLENIGKIVNIYYDETSKVIMTTILWYYTQEQVNTSKGLSIENMHEKELFASKHIDTVNVDCIESHAYVLTIKEFNRIIGRTNLSKEGDSQDRQTICVQRFVGSPFRLFQLSQYLRLTSEKTPTNELCATITTNIIQFTQLIMECTKLPRRNTQRNWKNVLDYIFESNSNENFWAMYEPEEEETWNYSDYSRRNMLPPENTPHELLYFCRTLYSIKTRRICVQKIKAKSRNRGKIPTKLGRGPKKLKGSTNNRRKSGKHLAVKQIKIRC